MTYTTRITTTNALHNRLSHKHQGGGHDRISHANIKVGVHDRLSYTNIKEGGHDRLSHTNIKEEVNDRLSHTNIKAAGP